jgi:hypothetical protein
MKRKPIKVDWDGLEDAFNNSDEELLHYLDLVTGQVALEGEGEESDDEDEFDAEAPPPPVPTRSDGTRLAIQPPDTDTKIVWLEEFLATDAVGKEVEAELRRAIDSDDPAEEIAEVLRDNPEVRERWFAYRSERIREMIDAWLASHGVETVDRAPWRD